jgi:hypothetical protein
LKKFRLNNENLKGTWLNNNMHGKGEYTWKDGRIYIGEY